MRSPPFRSTHGPNRLFHKRRPSHGRKALHRGMPCVLASSPEKHRLAARDAWGIERANRHRHGSAGGRRRERAEDVRGNVAGDVESQCLARPVWIRHVDVDRSDLVDCRGVDEDTQRHVVFDDALCELDANGAVETEEPSPYTASDDGERRPMVLLTRFDGDLKVAGAPGPLHSAGFVAIEHEVSKGGPKGKCIGTGDRGVGEARLVPVNTEVTVYALPDHRQVAKQAFDGGGTGCPSGFVAGARIDDPPRYNDILDWLTAQPAIFGTDDGASPSDGANPDDAG
jgi:hypothetical protein